MAFNGLPFGKNVEETAATGSTFLEIIVMFLLMVEFGRLCVVLTIADVVIPEGLFVVEVVKIIEFFAVDVAVMLSKKLFPTKIPIGLIPKPARLQEGGITGLTVVVLFFFFLLHLTKVMKLFEGVLNFYPTAHRLGTYRFSPWHWSGIFLIENKIKMLQLIKT